MDEMDDSMRECSPSSRVHNLPADWRTKPPKANQVPSGICVVECDASHKNGITGTSAIITLYGRDYGPSECAARSKGPIHAELVAVHKALLKLKQVKGNRRIHTLIIYTDCLYAWRFLENVWTPRRPYLRDILRDIAFSLQEIGNGDLKLVVCHTRTRHIRRIDRRATKKRKVEEVRQQAVVAERVAQVEAAIVRGRDVHVYEDDGQVFAYPRSNGNPPGFKVRLDPPSCSRSWWKYNWADKGPVVIDQRGRSPQQYPDIPE